MIKLIKQAPDVIRDVAVDIARLHSGEEAEQFAEAVFKKSSQDPAYAEEMSKASELLASVDLLADSPVFDGVRQGAASRRSTPAMAMVASLVVAVLIGVVSYFQEGGQNEGVSADRYVARVGEQKTIALEDGSNISLNTNTEVLVAVSDQSRRVILSRGEAYFEVAKSSEAPFVVEMGEFSVTVLGTSFNIHKEPGSVSVAVSDGAIVVHRVNELVGAGAGMVRGGVNVGENLNRFSRIKLLKGQAIEIEGADARYYQCDADELGLWRSGALKFVAVPLDEVVKELNRYSAKKILIEDRSIQDLPVTAVVKVDRVGASLRAFELAHDLRAKHYADRIVLLGDK